MKKFTYNSRANIDLQDKFSFSTKCMGRETFPFPNKREIRLKKRRGKKETFVYPSDHVRSRRETTIDGYRFSVGVHRADLKIFTNIYRAPRGLATRRRNKWGRHVSGYSLFAGKHLPGFSELPRQKGRQKDGKNPACQPRRLGQRKCKPHFAPLVGTTRPSSRQRGASPDVGPDKNVANHGLPVPLMHRAEPPRSRRAATWNIFGVMREPRPLFSLFRACVIRLM